MNINMDNNNNRVLIIGNGFLGKQYAKNGYEVWGREEFSFTNSIESIDSEVSKLLETIRDDYDVIINCIGKSDTRWCEIDENWDELFLINSYLVGSLSRQCSDNDIKFVHISSGCVYDRNDIPQKEDGFLASHCKYVVAKLAGEFFCDKSRDLILRPRLYFGESEDNKNLLSKVKRFDTFLTDINSFTSVQTVVEATEALLSNDCDGVFNVAQSGYANLSQLVSSLGIHVENELDGADLVKKENLHLVNNIMDISKLEKYYKPRELFKEFKDCYSKM